MKQDSIVYNYVWSVNVPKDGMGWDGGLCLYPQEKYLMKQSSYQKMKTNKKIMQKVFHVRYK